MKEEHAIALVLVGAVAFMLGWQLCSRRAAAPASSSGQGASTAAAVPDLPFSNQTDWLKSFGGLGSVA